MGKYRSSNKTQNNTDKQPFDLSALARVLPDESSNNKGSEETKEVTSAAPVEPIKSKALGLQRTICKLKPSRQERKTHARKITKLSDRGFAGVIAEGESGYLKYLSEKKKASERQSTSTENATEQSNLPKMEMG